MLHRTGVSVYYDTETVLSATQSEKQQLLAEVINGMRAGDDIASNTTYCVATDMMADSIPAADQSIPFDTPTSHGKLPTLMTKELIRHTPRLQGFTSAIHRWPEQEGVLDVGCGPFPVLALAAAVYHPRAEIQAIDINEEAASVAQAVVEAYGMNDRLHVARADIANYQIDSNITAAVTETFNAGLQDEPGPKIVQLLHKRGISLITPSTAQLRLSLGDIYFYQDIDLRTDTHARIPYSVSGSAADSSVHPDLAARYSDDFGPVLDYDTDIITRGLTVGQRFALRSALAQAGSRGTLTYELGHFPFTPTANPL